MKVYCGEEVLKHLEELIPVYQAAFGASAEKIERFRAQVESAVQRSVNPLAMALYEDARPVAAVWGIKFVPDNWLAHQLEGSLPAVRNWYEDTFEVNDLFVLPNRQGRGLGRRLMRELENYLAGKARHILLCTERNKNNRALGFYPKLGYEPVIKSVLLGGFDDVTVFAKAI